MIASYVRWAIGFVLMASACGFAWKTGARPIRQSAVLVAACWGVATVFEFALGRVEPVIVSDAICGVGFLRLAWVWGLSWLWAAVGVESLLFVLHAVLFRIGSPPTPLEVIGNNVLATLGLVIMVCAALTNRREDEIAAGSEA